CAYFNPEIYASEREVATNYKKVLAYTKIDVFMVQDGVGARGWEKIGQRIPRYFKAFQEACETAKIPLWGNLESYRSEGNLTTVPTTVGLLEKQFAAAADSTGKFRTFVTWDFFHYMNPITYGESRRICKGQPDSARKALYDAYRKKYVSTK